MQIDKVIDKIGNRLACLAQVFWQIANEKFYTLRQVTYHAPLKKMIRKITQLINVHTDRHPIIARPWSHGIIDTVFFLAMSENVWKILQVIEQALIPNDIR